MSFSRKLFYLITGLFLITAYNNCAQQKAANPLEQTLDKPSNPNGIENQGNGTPYGGKLKPGAYIPSANQICNSNFQEKIRVDVINNQTYGVLEVPCKNREVPIGDNEFSITDDQDRLMLNNFGYAHDSTHRAQSKDDYMVACRTTEQNFGAEILVYGPGPVYTFENISLATDLTVYETTMNFVLNFHTNSRHAFNGVDDNLALQETEDPTRKRFVGIWESNVVDTSSYQRMICDDLSETPVNEW